MTPFAQRLRTARTARGLSQSQLAALSQHNVKQLSEWERGCHRPDIANFAALCAALELSPVEVCTLLGLVESETT